MTSRDRDARAAGNILYGSFNNSHNSVVNHIDSTDSVIQHGSSSDVDIEDTLRRQPISPLRRTFCLVVLFDLILTVILWLIFTELKSQATAKGSSNQAFIDQVVKYHFKTSMFDTVILSTFRFVVLILIYALLKSKRPWFVAITTLATCVVMICKAIFYDYDRGSEDALEILDYILLITALVISWVETWLMDLRVLPHEKKEEERLRQILADRRAAEENSETSPLLPRFLRGARTDESYYSPVHSDSDDSSEDGDDTKSFHSAHSRHHSRSHSLTSSASQGTFYKSKIISAQKEGWEYLESDGWMKESGKDDIEGIVYSKQTKPWGKIFRLVAQIDADALTLYNDMVENGSGIPKWNPTVLEVRTLEFIDDNTEISYNIAAEGAAGMVASRDFVIIRHWEQSEGWYVTSSISVEHSAMPTQNKYVRGEQGPNVIRLKDVDTNTSHMEWLLITNLKGWLPQYLIDQALSGALMDYLNNLKKHVATFPSGAKNSIKNHRL